jgi:thioredoxin-related protein
MRRFAIVSVLCLWAIPTTWADEPTTVTPSTPAEVEWHSFDEGIEAAGTQGKHIMVDVYTDWCGWCKKLEKETYADYAVREVLSESYISVKLKGDSGKKLKVKGQSAQYGSQTLLQFVPTEEAGISEQNLTRSVLKITGFPTILFLAPDGRMITKLPGFHNARSFVNIINYIKDDLYEVMTFDDYLKSLERAEDKS